MRSTWGYGIILSALAAAPTGLARAPLPGPSRTAADTKRFDVKVSSANQRGQLSSLANPDVLAVAEVLEPALLESMDPDRVRMRVQEELNKAYAGSVSVRSSMTKYAWIWIPELMEWVLVCCNLTTFDVSLATTVQVDVEVVTRLDRS